MKTFVPLLYEGMLITKYRSKLIHKHLYSLFNEGCYNLSLWDNYNNCIIEIFNSLELNIISISNYIGVSIINACKLCIELRFYIEFYEDIDLIVLKSNSIDLIESLLGVISVSIQTPKYSNSYIVISLLLDIPTINELNSVYNLKLKGLKQLMFIKDKLLHESIICFDNELVQEAQIICNHFSSN